MPPLVMAACAQLLAQVPKRARVADEDQNAADPATEWMQQEDERMLMHRHGL
jgi:hypothetical protein